MEGLWLLEKFSLSGGVEDLGRFEVRRKVHAGDSNLESLRLHLDLVLSRQRGKS